ncbi:glutamate--cysteine ligase [Aestuariivirga litoralis]|uniref:glutamate--cysteine ligase n=1 Tax=Aestuariivirga litoralis TaxID=2650924 RepID=UPI002486759E|nr:glutamate--cysteine ligase [Aestuariivirga litoralis]MBG1233430.1 glutamate--cysteine ligase [Aestuariivirga litoralis]
MSGPTPETEAGRARISSKAQMIAYFEQGVKPRADWRMGTEHEKFPFLKDTLRPVPYAGKSSIKGLLEGLRDRYGWQGVYEGENIIALSKPNSLANISLEPGGQFELSGAPLNTVNDTCGEVTEHLAEVKVIGDELGIGFLGLGASPVWTRAETPVMPKGRYGIMSAYMDKVGTLGRDMMFRTCTVQVNLDFGSEADMVQKLRVSLALQPLGTALFANSPFLEGKPNGYLSFRSHVWEDTDNARAGMLPFVFEQGFGFEQYVDYALDVPMYFVMRDGKFVNCAGQSFRAFLNGRLPQLPGELPTMRDWGDHLTTVFPEVRLKKYLEMRGSDVGKGGMLCALPALWGGLFYDQNALDAAWDLVKGATAEQRQKLRHDVPKLGLKAEFMGRSLQDIAKEVLGLARAGLKARGFGEEPFLDVLDEIAQSGKTHADRLLDLYHSAWKGDIKPVFKETAF